MVALGGAPRPEHRGRRQWLRDTWLFVGCLAVVVLGLAGLLYGMALVMLKFVGALAP